MSGAIDQSGNYINQRLLLLFPPLGTNARLEKLAKIHLCSATMDQVPIQYFIIIWKESNRGASRQYLLHLHMTLLDGKLLMGETKYLIGGEKEKLFAGGNILYSPDTRIFSALIDIDNFKSNCVKLCLGFLTVSKNCPSFVRPVHILLIVLIIIQVI